MEIEGTEKTYFQNKRPREAINKMQLSKKQKTCSIIWQKE